LLDCTQIVISSFPFQPETTEPPAVSRSGKPIQYWPPRRAPYIGHKAPSISSVMKGPKTNLVLDNLPLSTLKRKGVSNKTLARKTKRKIDTVVVDASDMARVLASAFKVLSSIFSLSFYVFSD
jgi:hypothetical protein